MITPENVLRHELIGLRCKVVSARNKSQVGIEGHVVDETRKMLTIETKKGLRNVAKESSVFQLAIPHHTVEVSGSHLVAKPEDRIKKKLAEW